MSRKQPYLDRRGILMEQLQNGLILVRGNRAGEVNPSFFYLTGLAEPRGALLLAPGGTRIGTGRKHPGPDYVRGRLVQQLLFLPRRDELAARWGEDSRFTVEGAPAEELGFDAVLGVDELDAVLTQSLSSAERLHYVRETPPLLGGEDDPATKLASRIRRRFLNLEVRDASPVVHEMRRSKDELEIRAIERSVNVTAEALARALQALRPGLREHEIEAEIGCVYRAHGGTHAFDPIVATGANALCLHYVENSARIEPGQLVLIDTGVSIDGYKSDITRTVPADGRFTKRQREVYEIVLRAQQETIACCQPGALLGDIHARCFEVVTEAGFGDYLPHGIGHHLGLETHDAGDLHRPLKAGAVVTVEPGIYLPEEQIGIRIEDDVLVTEAGPRILGDAIPKTVEQIERAMAAG